MFEPDKLKKRGHSHTLSFLLIFRIPQSYGLYIPDELLTINLTDT